MNNVSCKIRSNDSKTLLTLAVMTFFVSVVLAVFTTETSGFLSFFLGFQAIIIGVASSFLLFAWSVYVFGDDRES